MKQNLISVVSKKDCSPTIHDFYIGENTPFNNTFDNTFSYAVHFKNTIIYDFESSKILNQMLNLVKQDTKIQLICSCKNGHDISTECHGEVIKLYLLSYLP